MSLHRISGRLETKLVACTLLLASLFVALVPLANEEVMAVGWSSRILVTDDNVNDTGGSDYPVVVADVSGNLYVVWSDGSGLDGSGPDADIFFRKWDSATRSWETRILVTYDDPNNTEGSHSPYVETDSRGNVHVVWRENIDFGEGGVPTNVYWRMWNVTTRTWGIRTLIEGLNETGDVPKLSDDTFGNMHVVWLGNNGIKYRKWNGTSNQWEGREAVSSSIEGSAGWLDIATDNQGDVHVAWSDVVNNVSYDVFYSRLDASSMTWTPIFQVNDNDMRPDRGSFLTSVNTDVFGNVYVVWSEAGDQTGIGSGSDEDVFYRKYNATTSNWEPRVLVSDDSNDTKASYRARACSDPFGNLHVAWEDRSDVDGAGPNNYGDIFYRKWNASAGVWERTISLTSDMLDLEDANNPDIACDAYGNFAVTWSDFSGLLGSGPDKDIYLRMYESSAIPPDYIPTDVSPSGTEHVLPKTSNLLSARVLNNGEATSSVSTIAFYNSTTPGSPFFRGSVQPLGNGETTLPYMVAWVSPVVPGTYRVTIEVDYGNNITESSEVNNFYTIEFIVVDRPPPPTNLTTEVRDVDDVFLNWTAPDSPLLDHYLIHRSTDQREFDFSTPLYNTSLDVHPPRTNWTDLDAANGMAPREYYYVVTAVDSFGLKSVTSNTAGKWTRSFQEGRDAFSLPLKPFVNRNASWYSENIPGTEFVRWMNATGHWVTHYPAMGKGVNDIPAIMGDSYEISLSSSNNFTFCGYPASMIRFQEGLGDSTTFRRSLSAKVEGNDINLSWESIAGATGYLVFRSAERSGLHNLSLSPIANIANTYWIDSGVVGNWRSEYYYMVIPADPSGDLGSSTYSIGVFTERYQPGTDTFALPLKPAEPHSLDWYCDNIPNVVGIIHLMKGYWRLHAREMLEGVYDAEALQAEGYQISIEGATTTYTFIGY